MRLLTYIDLCEQMFEKTCSKSEGGSEAQNAKLVEARATIRPHPPRNREQRGEKGMYHYTLNDYQTELYYFLICSVILILPLPNRIASSIK